MFFCSLKEMYTDLFYGSCVIWMVRLFYKFKPGLRVRENS